MQKPSDLSSTALGLMPIGPRDRILELNCGSGETSVQLAALVPEGMVAALDPSDENARAARRRAPELDNVLFIADIEPQIPWKEGFFSLALSHGWPKNLRDVLRVLAPGGVLYIEDAREDETGELQQAGFEGVRNEPAGVWIARKPE